jgi:hypothetical protein
MEPIVRPVRDIDADDRYVLEHVIGRRLEENQEVIIQVATPKGRPTGPIRQKKERSKAGHGSPLGATCIRASAIRVSDAKGSPSECLVLC